MFFPPLDSTVFVDVPSNAHAGGLSLLFRARTGSASALEQLKHDGVKVQAWTNAPVDDDRVEGEWGAYNFEEAVNSDDHSIVPFSLPPPIEDNSLEEPYTLFLTLKLRPLPRHQTKTNFLLTYRLLYPNGNIKWLGYYRRDLVCVLKKTDPWLAPPAPPNQTSGNLSRPFTSITMKEPWGCWAIGRRSVKYYPKGTGTDDEAVFFVLVPRRGPSTFALHQPIVLHGAGLKLDPSGVVMCHTSTATRVYTAIMSQPELSCAIPALDLHWFGVKEGFAFIASAAPEQPVSVYAVPLSIDTTAIKRSKTVSLDLASHKLLVDHQHFVVYVPLTNGVSDSDNWGTGTHQLPLSVGRSGGSCIVSAVYTLSSNRTSPVGKAPWGIAYVTPHTFATEPEQDGASVAGAGAQESTLEYDSETEFLNQEIKPSPLKPRTLTTVNPRRTVEFLIPLLWRTLGYLVRALIMRLFAMIGLPVSPLLSYLRPSRPKEDQIKTRVRAIGCESMAGSTEVTKSEHVPSERSEASDEAMSDSATEVVSSVGGERLPSSKVFNIPKGPFLLLAHTDLSKLQSFYPEVELDGKRLDLKITSLGHGWVIMQTKEDVDGGRVEINCTTTSFRNGSAP